MSEPATAGEPAASVPDSTGQAAAGAMLLKERRRQGLSLGDISRQLKLSVRQVEALERDDYSGYKGPVFIHGFIRNYAKLLGLDPEPLIRAADSMLHPPQVAVAVAAPREPERPKPAARQRPSATSIRIWPAAAIVLVVGIALAGYFGSRRPPEAGRSAPSVAARDKSTPSKSASEPGAGGAAKSRAEPRPEGESAVKPPPPAAARPETKTQPKPDAPERRAPPETGEANTAETSGRVTVRMIFEQDSWVEIKDRTGNTIFGQLNSAGSRRSVSGDPPLSVVVGNAAGVRLFQGDRSIDLAPHTRVDVARLTLE